MDWIDLIHDNASTTAVGLLLVVVSFNRLLWWLWPLGLLMPQVPTFSVAYSGYPSGIFLWSYVPIGVAIALRRKLGVFPRL